MVQHVFVVGESLLNEPPFFEALKFYLGGIE